MALRFDFIDSIIEIPAPTTSITLQTLINEIRDEEDELTPAMTYRKIADAYGKQQLSDGVLVGITLVLLDDWKLRFEARPGPDTVACIVEGGNLVAISGNPLAPSAFTSVTIAQSSSPTIATPDSDTNLLYLVESLLGKNRGVGNYFYWDPVRGDDTKDGIKPTTAVATFAQAQTLASDGSNDVIFCISSDPSGITTVTEPLTITKNNLKLRGPGYIFQLKPTVDTVDTVSISADNVEVSGLYVETAATGVNNGIYVTGDNSLIADSWIANVSGNGISVTTASRTKINNCAIEDCGVSGAGDGVKLGDSTLRSMISKCIISNSVNGVSLSGTGLNGNNLENNLIFGNSGYGITVGTGVVRTHVRSGHTFNKNLSGNTLDLGTDTLIETQAGGASASEIADAVWDEVISGHLGTNTTGKILRDTKTVATLASLK